MTTEAQNYYGCRAMVFYDDMEQLTLPGIEPIEPPACPYCGQPIGEAGHDQD